MTVPELTFTHPDHPDYVVEIPDGVDRASIAPPGDDWTLAPAAAEDEPAVVPVGAPIDLTPQLSADSAAPAEPETDQAAVSDTTKE